MNCNNCGKNGIRVLEAVFYSGAGPMRCRICGAAITVSSPIRWVYGIAEGLMAVTATWMSIIAMQVWPLVVAVSVSAVARVLILPRFARTVT